MKAKLDQSESIHAEFIELEAIQSESAQAKSIPPLQVYLFSKIKELLKVGQDFCNNVTFLIEHYKSYQGHLSPTDFALLEKAIDEHFSRLPLTIFEEFSCPEEDRSDISDFFKLIVCEFEKKIKPALPVFSSASVTEDYKKFADPVILANKKNLDLPYLQDGLAAPFQTITRFNLLLNDIKKIVSREDFDKDFGKDILGCVEDCHKVISDIAMKMNETIREMEKIRPFIHFKPSGSIGNIDVAEAILLKGKQVDVIGLVKELIVLINDSTKEEEKEKEKEEGEGELKEWLNKHFMPRIYKINTEEFEEKSNQLELMFRTIESEFLPHQLARLQDIIIQMNHDSQENIHLTEELSNLTDKLGIEYTESGKENKRFLRFISNIVRPCRKNTDGSEKKYPMLCDLILLIELKHELQDKEQERAEAAKDKVRQEYIVKTGCADSGAIGIMMAAKGEKSDYINADTLKEIAHKRVIELIHIIKNLDRNISLLNDEIAGLEAKKQNLIDFHKDATYKSKFPLHYAVKKANIAEIVQLLTSDKATEYNKRDDADFSPIYHAYNQGHVQIFQLLYEGIGITEEEKIKYKKLILIGYEQLKNKKEKGKISANELVALEKFREMVLLFKDPYHKLWNNVDPEIQKHPACDAQRVINILQDYCAPTCLSFLNNSLLQRFLTFHLSRPSINIERAIELIQNFEGFFATNTSPEKVKSKMRVWSLEKAIDLLNDMKERHVLYFADSKEESPFLMRLTYMLTKLELQLAKQNASTNSQSAGNLESSNLHSHQSSNYMSPVTPATRLSGFFSQQNNDNPSNNKKDEPSPSCIIS